MASLIQVLYLNLNHSLIYFHDHLFYSVEWSLTKTAAIRVGHTPDRLPDLVPSGNRNILAYQKVQETQMYRAAVTLEVQTERRVREVGLLYRFSAVQFGCATWWLDMKLWLG